MAPICLQAAPICACALLPATACSLTCACACLPLSDLWDIKQCLSRLYAARYVRPEFVAADEQPQLVIRSGRHPVLDSLMDEPVVPNDTCLRGHQGPRAAIITGPNMGGKSCYIRQAALIALMAQVCPQRLDWHIT